MLILGLLGMYFDAAVVFVTSQTLFLRLALAILWLQSEEVEKFFFLHEQTFIWQASLLDVKSDLLLNFQLITVQICRCDCRSVLVYFLLR